MKLVIQRVKKASVEMVKTLWSKVQMGKFGAYMEISLINDGPTTIILEA